MNDIARNTRTLIVSFVFAVMALIPLRFVEVGQMTVDSPQVLGEEVQQVEEVVLPNDEVSEEVVLEAPYNEIENQTVLGEESVALSDCIPAEKAGSVLSEYEAKLSEGGYDGETTDRMVSEMIAIEAAMCK